MEYLVVFGSLFAVHLLALVSPGPNVLVVTQTAMSRQRRTGVQVALGLASGAAIWASTALVGLNVVFAHLAWLYGTLSLAGGCYLVYLGVRLWRSAAGELASPTGGRRPIRSGWQAYQLGLLTTLTNPKAAIFFGGVFAALLPPQLPAWVKFTAVGLIIADSTIFHVGLAVFFSTSRVKSIYKRIKRYVDRITGTALVLLGLRLIVGDR